MVVLQKDYSIIYRNYKGRLIRDHINQFVIKITFSSTIIVCWNKKVNQNINHKAGPRSLLKKCIFVICDPMIIGIIGVELKKMGVLTLPRPTNSSINLKIRYIKFNISNHFKKPEEMEEWRKKCQNIEYKYTGSYTYFFIWYNQENGISIDIFCWLIKGQQWQVAHY